MDLNLFYNTVINIAHRKTAWKKIEFMEIVHNSILREKANDDRIFIGYFRLYLSLPPSFTAEKIVSTVQSMKLWSH